MGTEKVYKTDVNLKRKRSQTFVVETERELASKGEIKKNVVQASSPRRGLVLYCMDSLQMF